MNITDIQKRFDELEAEFAVLEAEFAQVNIPSLDDFSFLEPAYHGVSCGAGAAQYVEVK